MLKTDAKSGARKKKPSLEERVSILVVDDRPDKLMAVETVLSDLCTEVVKANSGIEALRLLLKQDFAVILLDVSMPGMDGFETASLIRQRARSEHTPIIFVTSINTTETHISRGYSLGAVDYIFSPVESEVLRAKVAVFIDLFRKTEQIRRQSEILRQEAEERAASLESRLHGLLNRLNMGIFRASSSGDLIDANPAFMRLIGIDSTEDLSTFNIKELIASDEGQNISLESADGSAHDVRFLKPDGSVLWILLSLSVTREKSGAILIEGVAEDITDRKAAEQILIDLNDTLERRVAERTEALRISQEYNRRSERLASLGTLAAGIAHEINNPLNAILMAAKYALKSSDKFPVEKALSIVCDEAIRGGKIVKGILKFAKEEEGSRSPTDLNELIRHTRDLAKAYSNKGKMSVELDLAVELPQICINPTAIEQVVVNLIANAAEASNGDAAIRVSTRLGEKFIHLDVSDKGPGIPQETLQHIFDPFFSTKRRQGGTGLGLSICHGIVSDHGGTITVSSEVGQGTTFSIALPTIMEN